MRKPPSFQWPYFTTALMYSSARLIPPLKATRPSITRILRWSRLFSVPERISRMGLKEMHLMPRASRRAA